MYVRIKLLLFSLQRQLETLKREREQKHTSIYDDINFDEKLYEASTDLDQYANKKDSGIGSEKSFYGDITEQLHIHNNRHFHYSFTIFVPPVTQQEAIDDDIYDVPPLTQQNVSVDDIYDVPPVTQQEAIDEDNYDVPPLTSTRSD